MNQVRIDDVALEAEALAVGAEALADAAQAAADVPPTAAQLDEAAQLVEAEEGYKLIALAIVAQGSELFAPNWHITLPEKTDLSDAIVQALLLWFPDGLIPPKYLAVLVVAGVGARIAVSRRDPITGELPPRHAPLIVKPTVSATANH